MTAIFVAITVLLVLQFNRNRQQTLLLQHYATMEEQTRKFDFQHLYSQSTSFVSSSRPIIANHSISEDEQQLLFHLVYPQDTIELRPVQLRCIESIFYHHPKATVKLYVNTLFDRPVQYLCDAGYNLVVSPYDIKRRLADLKTLKIFNETILQNLVNNFEVFMGNERSSCKSGIATLLRFVILYTEGGVVLGKIDKWTAHCEYTFFCKLTIVKIRTQLSCEHLQS